MRNHPRVTRVAVFVGLVLAGCGEPTTPARSAPSDIRSGALEPSTLPDHDFVPRSDNPYFLLVPGTTFHYRARTADGVETEDFTVTAATKRIQGVTARVIEDVVRLDGSVTEHTFDWFAQDQETGDVWYFGEDSQQILNGQVIGTEGSWQAGRDGAQAGIIMERHPTVGDTYREEFAPGVAEDMARVLSLDARAQVPYGNFRGCLKTDNFTPLDPDLHEEKVYCLGVGLVLETNASGRKEPNELVSITRP